MKRTDIAPTFQWFTSYSCPCTLCFAHFSHELCQDMYFSDIEPAEERSRPHSLGSHARSVSDLQDVNIFIRVTFSVTQRG